MWSTTTLAHHCMRILISFKPRRPAAARYRKSNIIYIYYIIYIVRRIRLVCVRISFSEYIWRSSRRYHPPFLQHYNNSSLSALWYTLYDIICTAVFSHTFVSHKRGVRVCGGEIGYREWKNKTPNETTARPGPYFLFPRRVSSRTGRWTPIVPPRGNETDKGRVHIIIWNCRRVILYTASCIEASCAFPFEKSPFR